MQDNPSELLQLLLWEEAALRPGWLHWTYHAGLPLSYALKGVRSGVWGGEKPDLRLVLPFHLRQCLLMVTSGTKAAE